MWVDLEQEKMMALLVIRECESWFKYGVRMWSGSKLAITWGTMLHNEIVYTFTVTFLVCQKFKA